MFKTAVAGLKLPSISYRRCRRRPFARHRPELPPRCRSQVSTIEFAIAGRLVASPSPSDMPLAHARKGWRQQTNTSPTTDLTRIMVGEPGRAMACNGSGGNLFMMRSRDRTGESDLSSASLGIRG